MHIKQKIIQGCVLIGATQLTQHFARLITALILVHYLLPDNFGVMAIIYSSFGFLDVLKVIPINKALIQKKTADNNVYFSVFWLNLIKDSIITVFLFIAVSLSSFSLTVKYVLYLFSLKVFIDSFSFVPVCILEKNLGFKKMGIMHLSETIIYSISVLLCVHYSLGIISFGIAVVAQYICRTFLSFLFSGWFPRPFISLTALLPFRSFSLYYYFARILKYTTEKSVYYFIAFTSNLNNVGLFYIATEIINIIPNQFQAIAGQVLFPVFSKAHDNKKLPKYYLKCLHYLFCICISIYVPLMILAPRCAPYFLSSSWQRIILPLQIIAISGIVKPISTLAAIILAAKDNIRDIFHCDYFAVPIKLTLIWLGIKNGLTGVAIAIVCFDILYCFTLICFSFYRLHISPQIVIKSSIKTMVYILAGIGFLLACTIFLPKYFFITFSLVFIILILYGLSGFYQLRNIMEYLSSD